MLRQRSRLVTLLAVFILSLLLIPGSGIGATPRLGTWAECIYLPLILKPGNSAGAPARGDPASNGCPPASAPAPALPSATATSPATATATATSPTTATSTATATSTTEPALSEVAGGLRLLPAHAQTVPDLRVRRYLVVLDASGSMSANFNGQCNNSGPIRQCANGPAGYPPVEVAGTGINYWWQTESERRIYVAKQAVERLVRLTNMVGNPGYDSSRPAEQMALVWFNHAVPASQAAGFSSDAASLSSWVMTANNAYGGYRSQGGTNSAAGLYRAALLLAAAPPTLDFGGQTYTYENHVIFITDGVSYFFLNSLSADLNGGQSTYTTYPKQSYCYLLGSLVVESAECQTTDVGGMYNGWDRPITQMINVSQDYLRSGLYGPTDVSVLALSNIPSTGLRDGVPSGWDYFFPVEALETYADGTTNVDAAIDAIHSRSLTPTAICQPVVAGSWVDQVDAAHMPEGAAGLGEVVLTSVASGAIYRAPIERDPASGQLSYRLSGLPLGEYLLQAQLFYKGDDGVTRAYGLIDAAGSLVDTLTVRVSQQSQALDLISLRLSGDVCEI